jgi:hypothetical protein
MRGFDSSCQYGRQPCKLEPESRLIQEFKVQIKSLHNNWKCRKEYKPIIIHKTDDKGKERLEITRKPKRISTIFNNMEDRIFQG